MNLLIDPWIPVENEGQITLEELLTSTNIYQLAVDRNDMEFAALTMLISLVQALFTPADDVALQDLRTHPMNAYDPPHVEWFDLSHPLHPFMQQVSVGKAPVNPIQKLVMLPGGSESTLFGKTGEREYLTDAELAIALFCNAVFAPNFTSNVGGPLDGPGVHTLVHNNCLRRMVWDNVLHQGEILEFLPTYGTPACMETPTWVEKTVDQTVGADIGLLRGLFYQRIHIEIERVDGYAVAYKAPRVAAKTKGYWIHPHCPRRQYKQSKDWGKIRLGEKASWQYLHEFVLRGEGNILAPAVERATGSIQLLVGGFHVKDAKILDTTFITVPLKAGWQNRQIEIADIVALALSRQSLLTKAAKNIFSRLANKPALKAEKIYSRKVEGIIYRGFKSVQWDEVEEWTGKLREQFNKLSLEVFDEVTKPHMNEPRRMKDILAERQKLNKNIYQVVKRQ